MSQPNVNVLIDLSNNIINVSSPENSIQNTNVGLCIVLQKQQFLTASGIEAVVVRDASGTIVNVQANARSNININYIKATADNASSTFWINDLSNNSIMSIAFTFNNGSTRNLIFDIANSKSLNGSNNASLGMWIAHIINNVINLKKQVKLPDFTNLSSLVLAINQQISNALGVLLSSQSNQTQLIKEIVKANGPITGINGGIVQMTSSFADLDIDIIINKLKVDVSYLVGLRSFEINNIPLRLRLR